MTPLEHEVEHMREAHHYWPEEALEDHAKLRIKVKEYHSVMWEMLEVSQKILSQSFEWEFMDMKERGEKLDDIARLAKKVQELYISYMEEES